MDVADIPWDECMEAASCYIQELEDRLKYTHSMAEREHIQFLILREKMMVNIMNRMEHHTADDIYKLQSNPYLESLCRLELVTKLKEENKTLSKEEKRANFKSVDKFYNIKGKELSLEREK
jgi:hypothetical protein